MRRAADRGEPVGQGVALAVLESDPNDLSDIMECAGGARARRFGTRVHLCSIVNARSGACPEDCSFCAQSARHRAGIETYGMLEASGIEDAYSRATELPISHFGVVTSGKALDDRDVEMVCSAVSDTPGTSVAWCASLGALDADKLFALKTAGLKRFHHNLETCESFFPAICSTHTFEDRVRTVRLAKSTGLEVCAGGLLGLGESAEQRVELAATLAREEVDSIPLNFLVPVAGTPLEDTSPMKPHEILKIVAMFRLMNPAAEIKVCAGRTHLGDMQSMIFAAGATGMMIGPLLTVAGQDVGEDLRMLADLGLEPVTG